MTICLNKDYWDFMSNGYKYYFKPHLFDENLEWCDIANLGKKHIVTNQNDFIPKDYDLIFVKSGYIRFYCNTNNKKDNFTLIVGQNSLANLGGVITGANRFSRATSETETELIIFDSYIFWDVEFIGAHSTLYMGMAKTLAKTIEILFLRSHYTCFHSSLSRICRIIIELTDATNNIDTHDIRVITQKDIAQLTGMHPVTVSRNLKKLRTNGILGKIEPFYIEIFDYQALKDLSNSILTL